MALRSLDNALPITSERPKKPTKAAALLPTQKQQVDYAVNDENKAPLPPSATADASIDYILSENLIAIVDPETKILGLVGGLESKDWLKVCESLNDARRFALFHSTILEPILDKVMLVIGKSMKNPRSAMIKTSIMASSDIFKAYGDKFLLDSTKSDAFDNVLLQLLLKASQDKKFVCEEAEKALKVIVDSMTSLPLLEKLVSYVSHSNMRIRAKAAVSISNCVFKMEEESMKEFGYVKLIEIGTKLLNDRLPEAREAARSMVIFMYKVFTKDEEEEEKKIESWQSFCQLNLSAIDALAMVKIVNS